jgi:hypothetical protein
MSILHTAQKNGRDPAAAFENILNAIQMGNNTKLIPLLMQTPFPLAPRH